MTDYIKEPNRNAGSTKNKSEMENAPQQAEGADQLLACLPAVPEAPEAFR